MASHLITCDCGQPVVVESRQAGESLTCSCGRSVSVPTLRQLRDLPLASAAAANATPSAWGMRQGLMTLLALVALATLAIVGYLGWSAPARPEFRPDTWNQMVDDRLSALTPEQAWHTWFAMYEPLVASGFVLFEHPDTNAVQRNIDLRRWLQLALAVLATGCVVALLAIAILGRPRATSNSRASTTVTSRRTD